MNLTEALRGRDNNFDVLRLGAATFVVIEHAYELSGRNTISFVAGPPIGFVGVFVFFAISGFLITMSWHRAPRVVPYGIKRFLRIWPALAVVVILTAFVLGPAVTSLPTGDYVKASATRGYVLGNLTMRTRYTLPGVFDDNPRPHSVNTSLWTLPLEVRAYILVAVVGLLALLLLRRRHGPLLFAASLAVLAVFLAVIYGVGRDAAVSMPGFVGDLLGVDLRHAQLMFLTTFLVGAILYLLRDRIRLRWDVAGVLLALWALVFVSHVFPQRITEVIVPAIVVPYVVLTLAFRTSPRLRTITKPGDMSYGIFLIHFPVMQTIVFLIGGTMAPASLFLIAFPITYALAYVSWRLIERPALSLKPGAIRKPGPPRALPGPLQRLRRRQSEA